MNLFFNLGKPKIAPLVILKTLLGFGFLLLGSLLFAAEGYVLPDSVREFPEEKRLEWLVDEGLNLADVENDRAFAYLRLGSELAIKLDDQPALLESKSGMARILLVEGFYDESLKLSYEGEFLAKELGDTAIWINFLFWESGAYNELGEFDKSVEVASYTLHLQKGKEWGMRYAWALNSLGEAYRYQGSYEKAESVYLEAYQVFREQINADNVDELAPLMTLENNLAHLYYQKEEFDKAQSYLDSLKIKLDQRPLIPFFLESNLCQIDLWKTAGRDVEASTRAQEMLNLAKNHNYPKYELVYAEWLASFNKARKDFESALQYFEREKELKEMGQEAKASFRITMQESELENLNLRNQNTILETEGRVQYRFNIALGGILILLIVFFWLQLRNNRKMRRLNALLHGQNERLDEANREINGLVGIVAHDLKSPLNKSIMLAELLKEQEGTSEEQTKLLDMIQKTCGNGGKLIQDLLVISSLEVEQSPIEKTKILFEDLVGEILKSFEGESGKKGIELHFEKNSFPKELETDPQIFGRILDNLISNALKFTKPGGNVWVTLSQTDGFAGISVRDDGPGIGAEDQKKMFGKFQRLSARPTGGESSNGLGLSIVKELVDRLGIKMEFDSELGKGTKFQLWLPLNRRQIV